MSTNKSVFELSDIVRQTSFDIHMYLRHGHFEKVYENALFHRLKKLGLTVVSQVPLNVFDEDGTELGYYVADLHMENILIVEVKAVSAIVNEHVSQILGYLRASRIEHGLLINFGSPKFQIKKYVLSK